MSTPFEPPGIIPTHARLLKQNRYNMSHLRRGRAMIFNHLTFDAAMELEPRLGTDKDMVGFSSLLVNYGFKVSCHQDYSLEDITHEITLISEKEDHTNEDCILIAVFTHGRYGMLAARDQMYDYTILYGAFSPEKCPSLTSKPKIFFIQACQALEQEAEDNVKSCIPTFPDFLVAYSASPGSSAVRDESLGTWYMTAVHKFLNKFAKGSSIEVMELLIHLNQIVHLKSSEHSKLNQMPFIVSTLTGGIRLIKERDGFNPLLQPATPGGTTTDAKGYLSNVTAKIPENVEDMINLQKPLEYELAPSRLKAIIFNHYKFQENNVSKRHGAKADVACIISSFRKLGFTFEVQKDFTLMEIKKALETVICNINKNEDTDCLLVIVSTKGNNKGELCAYDTMYPINEIWALFREKNCPGLKGKPKIFLIDSSHTNYVPDTNQTSGEESDFLFGLATVPNSSSYRDKRTGTWYIQAICDAINKTYNKKNVTDTDPPPAFHDLLSTAHGKINRRIESFSQTPHSKIKQIPCIASTCTRILRFPRPPPPQVAKIHQAVELTSSPKTMMEDNSDINRFRCRLS